MANMPNCPMCGAKGSPSASKTHMYCTREDCDLFDNPVANKVWSYFSMLRRQTKQLLVWHLLEDGIERSEKPIPVNTDRADFYKAMGLTEQDNRWTDQAYKTAKVERRG